MDPHNSSTNLLADSGSVGVVAEDDDSGSVEIVVEDDDSGSVKVVTEDDDSGSVEVVTEDDDSERIEVVTQDDGTRDLKYEEFLDELQEIVGVHHAHLRPQLASFISRNVRRAFWSRGLFRVAEAPNDPYEFFKAFVDLAPRPLQELLYDTRDIHIGYKILHMAVQRKNQNLAKLLIQECVLLSNSLLPDDSESERVARIRWVLDFIHAPTHAGSTALHFACLMGDTETVDQLTSVYDKLDIPFYMVWNFLDNAWMTPLHYAVSLKHEQIVKKLLQCKAYARHVNVGDWSMRTPLHVACTAKTEGPHSDERDLRVIGSLLNSPHVDVNALDCCRFTPLHWAVYIRSVDVVKMILSKAGERTIWSTEKDYDGRTVLQHALANFNPSEAFSRPEVQKQFYRDIDEHVLEDYGLDDSNDNAFHRKGKEIETLLLENPGVKGEVERLSRDRQVYVDAANAMLVGAALIASVTYGGWLQAPLGDHQRRSRRIVRVFWIFNSLSFFSAIASVMAGAGAVLPTADVYIGDGVTRVRDWLALTAFMLLISVMCALGSFVAAAYAAGTEVPNVDLHTTITSFGGVIACVLIGLFFLRSLYNYICFRPGWAQLLMSQHITRSFQKVEKEAKNHHKLWAYWTRFRVILEFLREWTRGRQSGRPTSMHHQYLYEALRKRAFERALRLLILNHGKYWPWLEHSRHDLKVALQALVFKSFDKGYLDLKNQGREQDKHQHILQCVNDECPPGYKNIIVDGGQHEDLKEVLEEIVTKMVIKCSGRGLLHIFLDLPTTSCRDICLRNNMMDFNLQPFPGS